MMARISPLRSLSFPGVLKEVYAVLFLMDVCFQCVVSAKYISSRLQVADEVYVH